MIYIVCSIRDRAADVFAQPFYQAAVGQAVRSFSDAINANEPTSALCMHPEDFDLYQLGTYDDSVGMFECSSPRQIAIGKDMKIPK